MEVTINLPIKDWYHETAENDLDYWGLDYPPVTAYQSYVYGLIMRYLEPNSMALQSSRGYETKSRLVLFLHYLKPHFFHIFYYCFRCAARFS